MNYPIEYHAKRRVCYYDTDRMGVVWHGNYIKIFEDAREETFRSLGFPYAEVESRGIIMPIVEVSVKYHRPAHYNDILDVKVTVDEPPRSRLTVAYEITLPDGGLCATGTTVLAFVSAKTLAPCRPPVELSRQSVR